MRDRADDSSHHEWTLLPWSYILLLKCAECIINKTFPSFLLQKLHGTTLQLSIIHMAANRQTAITSGIETNAHPLTPDELKSLRTSTI